jgi:hypothetical protein
MRCTVHYQRVRACTLVCASSKCVCHRVAYLMKCLNPKPCGYLNLHCRADRSHIWLLRWPIGEREALRHAPAVVGSSGPTLRKSKRPCRRLQNCLVRRLLVGGVPRLGGGGRGGLRSQLSLPSRPKYTKTGGFAHVLAYKSPKMPFFTQKYLTRYTHETFF